MEFISSQIKRYQKARSPLEKYFPSAVIQNNKERKEKEKNREGK